MRAPIWNDTVAAVRSVAFAAIANDRMIRNAWGEGELVDLAHEAIVGRKRVDAVGHAFDLPRRCIRYHNGVNHPDRNCGEEKRRLDQFCSDASDPIRSHQAAAMRFRKTYKAVYLRPVIIDQSFLKQ